MDQENGKEVPPDVRPLTEKETLDFLEMSNRQIKYSSDARRIQAEINARNAEIKNLQLELIGSLELQKEVEAELEELNKVLKIKKADDIRRIGDRMFVRIKTDEPKPPLAENVPADLSSIAKVTVTVPPGK